MKKDISFSKLAIIKLSHTFDESYVDIFWVDAQINETLRPKTN
jgi:hypothetical protein